MSYCRFSKENNLYLYHHFQGFLMCHNSNGEDYKTTSRSEMIDYLNKHQGRNNPEASRAIKYLREEIITEGDDIETED